jgi:hypothetical protein
MNGEIEWTAFMRGFVFWETPQPEFGPPGPDTVEDLAEWLTGFEQAYADYPDTLDPEAGESLSEALDRLLAGHPALPFLTMMLRPL